MVVSGVFNSCETLDTNVVFCAASRRPACACQSSSDPPITIEATKITTSSPPINTKLRAVPAPGTGPNAATLQCGASGVAATSTSG